MEKVLKATIVLGLVTIEANGETLVRKHRNALGLATDGMEHHATQQKKIEVDARGNVESFDRSVDSTRQLSPSLVRKSMEIDAIGNAEILNQSPSLVRKSKKGYAGLVDDGRLESSDDGTAADVIGLAAFSPTTAPTPALGCSNDPSPWMVDNNKTCESWRWGICNRCNQRTWQYYGYCQQSCYDYGYAVNADCSNGNCTNTRTDYMIANDKYCETWSYVEEQCDSNYWLKNKFCQQSCYDEGYDVQGDCGTPMATPTPHECLSEAFPSDGFEFYFGSELPSSAGANAILDAGEGYGQNTAGAFSYGWNCDGNANVNYASGKRGLNRGHGFGLNHFDRANQCKNGSTYLPVNWELKVPNGDYSVEVDFVESFKGSCAVEGTNSGCGSGSCKVAKQIRVSDGRFTVTGYGHDSRKCHSLSKVVVSKALLSVNPQSPVIKTGETLATVTVSWSATEKIQIWVSHKSGAEKLFACGTGQGSQDATWIGSGTYDFAAYSASNCSKNGRTSSTALSSVQVVAQAPTS